MDSLLEDCLELLACKLPHVTWPFLLLDGKLYLDFGYAKMLASFGVHLAFF